MAKILVVTSGITSIVLANIAMSQRLRLSGHEVIYACDANVGDQVKAANLPFVQLNPPVKSDPITVGGRLDRWRARWRSRPATWQSTEFETRFGLDRFATVLDQTRPDLVLIDAEEHRFVIAAQPNFRVALVTPFLSPWKLSGASPLHLDVESGRHADAAWTEYLKNRKKQRLIDRVITAGHDPVSLHRALAKQYSFDWARLVDFDQWQIPFFYKDLPILNLNARELDYDGELPTNAYHVGPMINRDRVEQADAGIDKFIGRERRGPFVYCASGQFQASYDTAGLERIFAAARLRPDWDFIVVTGGTIDASVTAVPDNVLACNRAPQLKCLESADAAVIHGGIVSMNECIATNTPMLMYSLGIRDQDGAVARVRDRGAGLAGSRQHDTAADMITAIERLLSEESFASAVTEMSTHFQRYSDERVLETTVDEILETDKPGNHGHSR